jgi:hypothetical protein
MAKFNKQKRISKHDKNVLVGVFAIGTLAQMKKNRLKKVS